MKIEPLYIYLISLSVIEPARIQDIEKSAILLFPEDMLSNYNESTLRIAHSVAREEQFVIPVRRGVYCLTRSGRAITRRGKLSEWIDNRRFFLIKEERRAKKLN